MIGETFSRLTVIAFSHSDRRHRKWWLCRCVCGAERTLHTGNLRSGNTKSCGCLRRDKEANRLRLPNDAGVVNQIILQYRRHARDRGLTFNISRELFESLVRSPCHYCGTAGSNLKVTKNCREGFRHNGIDRVDSSVGYEPGNVVPACKLCNLAKRDLGAAEFVAWARRIASHQDAMADQWSAFVDAQEAA